MLLVMRYPNTDPCGVPDQKLLAYFLLCYIIIKYGI